MTKNWLVIFDITSLCLNLFTFRSLISWKKIYILFLGSETFAHIVMIASAKSAGSAAIRSIYCWNI